MSTGTMRLAFCLFKYFPFGGLQRDFLRIAKECVRRGHQVVVYTMAWEGERDPDISIEIIPVRGSQNHVRAKQFVKQIQSSLDQYDLVVGFNKMPLLDVYYAADTCYQAKARSQRGAWYRLTPRYRHLIEFEQAVFAPSAQTQVLLLSEAQQADFMHYYQTSADQFKLLPPGIAKDRKAPLNADVIRHEVRKQHAMGPDDYLLLMVGSGFKTKGLDRAILALAALPNEIKNRTYLYVIGKDSSDIFERQARKSGVAERVKFLGGRHDVSDWLLAADLLLHPAYNENTGTVLLEALISGLPVLTTDVCGYAKYITQADAGKVLSSPFNQIEFNQTISTMLHSSMRPTWKKNALSFAEQADIYSMPQKAADYIESLK